MAILTKLWEGLRRVAIFLATPAPRVVTQLDIVALSGFKLRFQLSESADRRTRRATVALVDIEEAESLTRTLTRDDAGVFASGLQRCERLARDLAPAPPPDSGGWRSLLQRRREASDPLRDLRILVAFASEPTDDVALGAVLGVRGDEASRAFYLCFVAPKNEPRLFVELRLDDLPKIARFMTQAAFALPPRA